MTATYRLLKSDDLFVFELRASNGGTILTGERYVTKAGALSGIESARRNSLIDARYQRRRTSSGLSYFLLVGVNGEVVGRSDVFNSTISMEACIAAVGANGLAAVLDDRT